ncbi:hypothetical protein ACFWMX_14855 [Streptomyces sp. NPDC058378]|uniref:hypothetical protein n=1 Tax=Streptomyces sp. NPDC058378 TaxID=3346469 RepID=UPI0036516017
MVSISSPEAKAAQRFKSDTADHVMTVLREDGLYRHLKFETPQYGSIYRYDLITWPHGLLIRGDGPNFVFSLYPTADLFEMFKGSSHHGINPDYWSEKVVAGTVKSWSEEKFRSWLLQAAGERAAKHPGLIDEVRYQILESDEFNLEFEELARHALASFTHPEVQFQFPLKWVVDFDDYDWTYLWACHAIVHGIAQYDAARKAVAA